MSRYARVELIDRNLLAVTAGVKDEPPLVLVNISDDDFDFELVLLLTVARNVDLEDEEWLQQAQRVFVLRRQLQLTRRSINVVDRALHGLIEDLLDAARSILPPALQRVLSRGRKHFDRRAIVVGMFEHCSILN